MDWAELNVRLVETAQESASLMAGCKYQGSRIGVAFRPQLCFISAQLIQIDVRTDLVFHRDQMASAIVPVASIDPNVDPAIWHGLLRSYKDVVYFLFDEPIDECAPECGTLLKNAGKCFGEEVFLWITIWSGSVFEEATKNAAHDALPKNGGLYT